MINTIRSVKSHMDDDEAKDKKTNETYFKVQELTKKNDCEKRGGRA